MIKLRSIKKMVIITVFNVAAEQKITVEAFKELLT